MSKTAILKKSIVVMLINLSICCFLLLNLNILNFYIKKDIKNEVRAADVTISNLDDLKKFANTCFSNNNQPSTTDKLVVLNSDIDCKGETLNIGLLNGYIKYPIFNGTFDGQGHKIYNFKMDQFYKVIDYVPGGGYHVTLTTLGFFRHLGPKATVMNLKLSSFSSVSITPNAASAMVVGGIAGYMETGAKIDSCVVENFTHNQYANVYVSGIFAYGNGTVSNCYVENINGENPANNIGAITVTAGIGPCLTGFYWTGSRYQFEAKNAVISKCIVNKSGYAYTSDISEVSNVTNCYSSPKQVTGLNFSHLGGNTGTTWYYAEDYNDGYPLLRQFTLLKDWKNVVFNVQNNLVSAPKSITIPADATKTYSSSGDTIIIYNQQVKANKVEGYNVKGWITNNVFSYTIVYEEIILKLTFNTTSGNAKVAPDKTSVDVKFGVTINFEADYTNNVYKYVINNKDNSKIYIIYDLSSYNSCIISNPNIVNGEKIVSNLQITPYASFKQYNVEFQ